MKAILLFNNDAVKCIFQKLKHLRRYSTIGQLQLFQVS